MDHLIFFLVKYFKIIPLPPPQIPLLGFSGIMQQIIPMEHNMVKNPNW